MENSQIENFLNKKYNNFPFEQCIQFVRKTHRSEPIWIENVTVSVINIRICEARTHLHFVRNVRIWWYKWSRQPVIDSEIILLVKMTPSKSSAHQRSNPQSILIYNLLLIHSPQCESQTKWVSRFWNQNYHGRILFKLQYLLKFNRNQYTYMPFSQTHDWKNLWKFQAPPKSKILINIYLFDMK